MIIGSMPDNLKLVLEHLNAVRELNRYLRKKGVKKDLGQYLIESLKPSLEENIPNLKDWNFSRTLGANSVEADWYPDTWKLDGELYVALCVILPDPSLADQIPSVNLYVPTEWPSHSAFTARSTDCVTMLLAQGFGLDAEENWEYPEQVIGKYVGWLEKDGSFSETKLVERLALEATKIVRLEAEISRVIRDHPTEPVV